MRTRSAVAFVALAVLVLAVLGPDRSAVAQTVPMTVPDLCDADSAAAFLGFAVRETRRARVFAWTTAQRFVLLRLEAAILDELERAPLSPDDRRTVEDIYLRDDQTWVRGMRQVAESSTTRDSLLAGSYRIYADAATQELGVRCRGQPRWPALYAQAREAARLR
jgi:hypothetical protein